MSKPSPTDRLYGALLRLYPADFRARFGDSMRATFAADARSARERGILPLAWFWARSVGQAAVLAAVERRSSRGRRRTGRGRGAWPNGVATEVAHAGRRLARSPGFTFAAATTLALGIGANTAIFSVVRGVVLEPLPHPHAERLVSLQHSADGAGLPLIGTSLGTYTHYREHAESFEAMTVFTTTSFALLGDAGSERVPGAAVSRDFFEIFLEGAPPLGRAIGEADQIPGAPAVAMISHELWSTRYGGDPAVVGRAIQVDGVPTEVIGVLPPDFDVPSPTTQMWLPERIDPETVILGGFGRDAVGRLEPGISLEQAESELQRLIPTLADRFNPVAFDLLVTGGRLTPIVRPLKERVLGDAERMLWILLGTAFFVLSVASANVANLFLVRAETERREIALRRALGAGRFQIARHHLTESVLLGALGGAGGVLVAVLGVRWVVLWGPSAVPRLHEVEIDAAVLAFAASISLLAALAFGSIPVLRRTDRGVAAAMSDGGRGTTHGRARHRSRNTLVVAQVSLALILMVGAGLMVRTFINLREVELGFDPRSALVFRVGLPEALYPDRVAAMQFHERLLARLAELPGVAEVGATPCLPLDPCDGRTPIYAADQPVEPGVTPPSVDVRGATSGFFEAMRIPLVEGRTFETADTQRKPSAAIVSENLARRLWPGESAIGKRIYPDYPEEDAYTVVGVVGSIRALGLAEELSENLWVSFLGPYGYVAPPHALTFVVRADVPPLSLAPAIRSAVRELDPNVPLSSLGTLADVVDRASAPTAFATILLVIAGLVALALGWIGIYGVLSYIVAQRAGEIGVRMAMGAETRHVARMIVGQGARLVALGMAVGIAGAIALTRSMTAVLFGVEPLDPLTYAGVGVSLALVALAASYLPARRAASVDPVEVLRSG